MRALLPIPLLLLACSESAAPPAKGGAGGHHAHASPRGGTLVEIGAHVAQVDLVLDPATGALHAYVMDGHASKAVRIPQESIAVTVEGAAIVLEAQADPLSGETVGDTSHFRAVSERLKGKAAFAGRIGPIRVFGEEFEPVPFTYGR